MKIGILTLPLGSNIGGVLQAYALQHFLCKMSHTAIVIDRKRLDAKEEINSIDKLKDVIKLVYHIIREFRFSSKNAKRVFIEKYIIPMSPPIYSKEQLKYFVYENNLNAVIVGSDQVWRKWNHDPCFTDLSDYFLDFISEDNRIIKIAYAVSFGLNTWEVRDDESVLFRRLVSNFKSVSVREKSGIDISKNILGIDSIHVLDPTMLLNKEEYMHLFNLSERKERNSLFCYFLDDDILINQIIKEISVNLQLNTVKKCNGKNNRIENWLQGIYQADYVLTDSFHGCVFSVLFNKPFVVYGNEIRGTARIKSLLEMFNLENRLVYKQNIKTVNDLFKQSINWHNVNSILQEWRLVSTNFINESLKS